jgi:hypothetical protein
MLQRVLTLLCAGLVRQSQPCTGCPQAYEQGDSVYS